MAISRRQFIRRTGLISGGLLGHGLMANPFVRRALADVGDRFFLVVFLDGGNDGLNTVTPIDNGGGTLRADYEAHRTNIRLAASGPNALLPIGNDPNTGAPLGVHPGLGGLKELWDLGKLAVVQGCGYPQYNLSHEESRLIWQTADPLGQGGGTGWFGRYLANAGFGGSDIPGVIIDYSIPVDFRQNTTSVLAINRLADFGFPYDFDYPGDDLAKRNAFLALYAQAMASSQPLVDYVGNSGNATLLSSESYPPLHDLYKNDRPSFDQMYDDLDNGFARDVREVAKIVYGVKQGVSGVNARFFEVFNGGYDTHSDQGGGNPGGQHYDLHKEVGDALRLFYADGADMGAANDVCVLVWSEFSRRIEQNNNGTDHGSQGPMFLIGGSVNGGVYGNHPNIADAALDDNGNTVYSQNPGNGFRSTDFRDVYGTVLKRWLGMSEATILANVLPADPGGYDPNFYWVGGNHDFDLGFLPP